MGPLSRDFSAKLVRAMLCGLNCGVSGLGLSWLVS